MIKMTFDDNGKTLNYIQHTYDLIQDTVDGNTQRFFTGNPLYGYIYSSFDAKANRLRIATVPSLFEEPGFKFRTTSCEEFVPLVTSPCFDLAKYEAREFCKELYIRCIQAQHSEPPRAYQLIGSGCCKPKLGDSYWAMNGAFTVYHCNDGFTAYQRLATLSRNDAILIGSLQYGFLYATYAEAKLTSSTMLLPYPKSAKPAVKEFREQTARHMEMDFMPLVAKLGEGEVALLKQIDLKKIKYSCILEETADTLYEINNETRKLVKVGK